MFLEFSNQGRHPWLDSLASDIYARSILVTLLGGCYFLTVSVVLHLFCHLSTALSVGENWFATVESQV